MLVVGKGRGETASQNQGSCAPFAGVCVSVLVLVFFYDLCFSVYLCEEPF